MAPLSELACVRICVKRVFVEMCRSINSKKSSSVGFLSVIRSRSFWRKVRKLSKIVRYVSGFLSNFSGEK